MIKYHLLLLVTFTSISFGASQFKPGIEMDFEPIRRTLKSVKASDSSNQETRRIYEQIHEQDQEDHGFIQNRGDGHIIITIPQHVLEDGCTALSSIPYGEGRVARQLDTEALKSRQDSWLEEIRAKILSEELENSDLIITGKGDSGRLAELLAMRMRKDWEIAFPKCIFKRNQIKVVTYFSRPVGDRDFAAAMDRNIGIANILRFTNVFCDKEDEGFKYSGIPIHFSVWEQGFGMSLSSGIVSTLAVSAGAACILSLTPAAAPISASIPVALSCGGIFGSVVTYASTRCRSATLPSAESLEIAWRNTQRNYHLDEEADLQKIGKFGFLSVDRNPITRSIYRSL